MRLFTKDDFIELYSKIHQRGIGFILSKLTLNATKRTRSTFNKAGYAHSNWWIIPEVKERWNQKVSSSPNKTYEEHIVDQYLKGKSNLKLLSLGSGSCSHELNFARHSCFSEIKCIDLSDKLLKNAGETAKMENLKNLFFEVSDVNKINFPVGYYDIALFNSSLHHFQNIHKLIGQHIPQTLKEKGLLIINEYVGPNRLQWTKLQLTEINRILKHEIPTDKKRRLSTGIIKHDVTGPGVIRMLITDPSEAIESENILPAIHSNFTTLEEKQIGGNILMLLFKDISHNFLEGSKENKGLLNHLFSLEDKFLEHEKSNIVFGIYQNK